MIWLITLLLSFSIFAKFEPLDSELRAYPYPYPVLFQEVDFAGAALKMAYMDIKPEKANGQTIVLLHGKNFSGAYWEKTANELVKDGYRVIIPDQIGFGKSSKPKTYAYTLQALAQNTQAILKKFKISKYIVVGHSMGGMLGIRYALMYPDQVTKLLLINPIGLEDWKLKIPYHSVEENYQNELKANTASIKKYQQDVYYAGNWKPEYDKGIEILAGWTLHPSYKEIAWSAALTTDMVFTQPVIYEVGLLKMPTLLMVGTRDRTAVGKNWASDKVKAELGRYDLLGKEVIAKIPQGKLVEIPNVGHMPMVEVFDQYIKHLKDFIRN